MRIIIEAAITINIAICALNSLANWCPEQNLCQCKFYGKKVDLSCIGTKDLLDLKECLKEKFSNYSIRTLFVKKCNATSLPARIIENLNLTILYLRCPLLNFSVDAFVGSYVRFYQFRLYNHKLTVIPNAFTHSPEVDRVIISRGALKSVEEQLRSLTKLELISLRMNRIEYISPTAFSNLTLLREIHLAHNLIKLIDPNTFESCMNVMTFKISDNYLESAEGLLESINPVILELKNNRLTDIHIFHPGMSRTDELHVGGNPVRKIDHSVFQRYLVNLVTLDLSNMSLTYVAEDAFPSFPALTNLDLSNNDLESIHKRSFNNLSKLATLNLSRNKLSTIKGILNDRKNIRRLDISFNRIVDLEDSLKGAPYTREFKVNNNKIQALTDQNFKITRSLREICAARNNISIITKNCFKYLTGLRSIDLSSNRLVTLNGSIQNLPRLNKLYLAYNRIEKLQDDDFENQPELTVITLIGNQLNSLNGRMKNLRNLEYLNLQKNNISTLSRRTFPALMPIEALFLKGNPLICDCRLEWLNKWSKRHRRYLKDKPLCQAPYWLKGKYFKNVSISDLVHWKESCPSPCECSCIPNGFELGVNVDCSHNNLIDIPDVFPSRMIGLDLSHNNLTIFRTPSSNLSWFYQLQELNVENNLISSMQGLPFLKNLSTLRLANNRLETLAVEHQPNYSLVTLSGNPWLCDCSTLWFRNWLFTLKEEIIDVNQTKCEKGNVKSELLDTPIIYLSESEICPQKIALYISISMGVLVFLLFVSSSAVAYFRYSLNIKIWLYSHGFTWVKEDDIDKDKEFDAFVSYSSHDENFVYEILRPTLENGSPAYLLCIHDRNFPAGNNIQASIIASVKYSRRTILILSKNFLESEWCTLEFRTAHLQALKDKINRVIIIVYGELPPEKDIEEELRVYLKSTTYLIWGEKYFWQKLHYALPKVKKERERVELHYDENTHLLVGY